MNARWTVWVDAKTGTECTSLLDRLAVAWGRKLKAVDVRWDSNTNAHKASFTVPLEAASWNDAVVEVIALGQSVGYAWSLRGSVLDDVAGDCMKSRIAGINGLQWHLGAKKGTFYFS